MIASTLTATTLIAAPQAVVFDWGNVLATEDRSVIVDFMCETFQFSEADFEAANLKKREAVKLGKSDIDFWIQFAKETGIHIPANWSESYIATLKASIGANPDMFELINELKKRQIRVGLLSNINDRYTKLIRDFGFYQPFDPCLLSCEIGLEKPNRQAYEALLQAINIPAEEIVFIDDKLENVEAAKKMGIDAIVFESSQQVREELSKRALLKR
jgi:putative hydrolase of the HAD superfamily